MKSDCVKKLDRGLVSIESVNASPDWAYFCSEERYAQVCSLAYHPEKNAKTLFPGATNQRIDRATKSAYSPTRLSRSEYVDYHCPRPFGEHKDTILSILRASGSDV